MAFFALVAVAFAAPEARAEPAPAPRPVPQLVVSSPYAYSAGVPYAYSAPVVAGLPYSYY